MKLLCLHHILDKGLLLGFDEWDENRDVPDVSLVLSAPTPSLQTRGFKERHSREPGDEEHDKYRRSNGEVFPASENCTARHIESKPEEDLAKVVGVPRDAPEARRDELALIGRVASKH